MKYFLGLGVNELPPDHTTLTAFKKRILENGKLKAYERLLKEITSTRASPGSAYDGLFLPPLVESDLEEGIPLEIVACPGTPALVRSRPGLRTGVTMMGRTTSS